jgi:hypothetical protein
MNVKKILGMLLIGYHVAKKISTIFFANFDEIVFYLTEIMGVLISYFRDPLVFNSPF